MKKTTFLIVGILTLQLTSLTVRAAFIIEPRPGKAFSNYRFAGTGGTNSATTTDSSAFGLTPSNGSAYGGGAATSDDYAFRYTPGSDIDNTPITAGLDLGNGDLASGLTGGVSGTYNVYVTWPTSSNVDPSGTDFSLVNTLSPGSPILTVNGVIQDSDTAGVAPGADAWFLLGSASLTAGQSYELHSIANSTAFVSQRMDGVMFELQPVPEPSTIALGLLGGAGVMFSYLRRRAKS